MSEPRREAHTHLVMFGVRQTDTFHQAAQHREVHPCVCKQQHRTKNTKLNTKTAQTNKRNSLLSHNQISSKFECDV